MDLTKLNYPAINEEFCYWYFKTHGKLPKGDVKYSKQHLIKYINRFRSDFNKQIRSNQK